MANTIPTATILSHWYKLLEGLESSSLDFYSSVERVLERRQVPDAKPSRIDWKEGGVASAKREYLRVTRGRFSFDICAAPFGTGFFVSWWLGEPRPSPLIPTVVAALGFSVLWGMLDNALGTIGGFVVTGMLVMVGLWLVGTVYAESEWEVYIVVIPVLGTIFERLFRPPTYYRIDTALMFQETVRHAVLEVIDELTKAKGLRALSELERKPIMREFYQR